ncbi:cytotoxic and regulatory T-cell molecule isoform 3-T3 [Anomaloglossus baeobatrachus]|uniref:cytotoxic and regulatory T-cell molecule isoform X3 n=1 Tax=Anomaloglossus baeobatrachus TaxID=238106 RepID=UPI003F4F5437
MIVVAALYVLLMIIMSKVKAEFHTSRLSVEEGKAVTLRCAFPRSNGADIQWVTPRGYTSYFNGEKVLKDRRHQLVESSGNTLIVRLSNVTRADEGVYSCLCYSSPLQTRTVRLAVLAAPSSPSLEVVRIPGKGLKEKYLLICSSSGGRPCPKLTWLIHDHTEVLGHHNRRLKSDGRCTAVSSLRVSAASHTSKVRCVVRHRTLNPGNLTVSYSFHTVSADTEAQVTESSRHRPSDAVTWTPSTEEHTIQDGKASGRKREDEARVQGTSSSPADTPDVNPANASNETSFFGNATAAEITNRNVTDGADVSVTTVLTFASFSEGNSLVITDVTTTRNTNDTAKYDVESRRESHRNLILVLVSLMLCILLVIVHLFLIKLRKAHYSWKKENETSDQTLESTKSRSNNEETSSQTRNAAPPAENAKNKPPGIQYNNQVSL